MTIWFVAQIILVMLVIKMEKKSTRAFLSNRKALSKQREDCNVVQLLPKFAKKRSSGKILQENRTKKHLRKPILHGY